MKLKYRFLRAADWSLHRAWDWYINFELPGERHLPGWGHLQLWQNKVCNAFENEVDRL